MSSEEDSDLKQCRTCDTKSKKRKCLFEIPRNEKLSLAVMLMGCAAVQVSKDDGLPSTVCFKCSTQLKKSYEFKLQCEIRDRIFRKVIKNAEFIKTDVDVDDDIFEQVELDNPNYPEERLEDDVEVKVDIIPKAEDSRSGEESDHTFYEENSDHSYVPDEPIDIQPPELLAAQKSKNLIVVHRCKICVRDFSCLSKLQRHMKIHCPKTKKLYICTLCNKTVARKEHLKRHIMANHVKTKPHMCKTCARGFIDVDALYAHEKICTGQKPHICDLCNTSFTREDSLQVHLRLHDENVLRNPVLDELDNIENYIRVHEIKPERLDGSVINNEDEAKEKFLLNTEFLVVKKEKKRNKRGWKQKRSTNDKFTCKNCGEEFKGPFNYKQHMVNEHKEPNPFVCMICPKVFPRFDHYKRHVNCHKERKYPCELCPRKFTCNSLLSKHLSTRHNEDREKMFPCNNCNKSFLSEPSRKLHMNNFCLTNRIYNCKRCLLVFPTKEDLVKHLRLANECSKRFLCSECGQRFTKKEYLIIHMRRHTGERPFKCNNCDKAFARTSDLKSHMKSHTGEKNHICIVCGKGFARAYMLSVHMRTHPGEKPYICEHCNEGFVHNHALRLHMQEHHPDFSKPKYLTL